MVFEQGRAESMSGKIGRDPIKGIAEPSQSDIGSLIEPYRRELHLHCYRLLGSLYDAEDVVQETMLRAWRHFDTFTSRGPGSLRTWLYTIATNASLDALKKRSPRTLPTATGDAAEPERPIAPRNVEALWLEPFPDSWLADAIENPEARYTRAESVSLAFLTALQLLPPRQRAILILSDVLDWRAAEIAHLLEITLSAVNSALHRARVTLEKNYHSAEREIVQVAHSDATTSALLSRYLKAWESDDVDGLVALLKEDATMSMPPVPSWYQGRAAIRWLLLTIACGADVPRKWRMIPTHANGQPAFALYRAADAQSDYRAYGVQVVTLAGAGETRQIADVTAFLIPELVTAFGCPMQLAR
jgi:RNA polymerase sigma-70 factor, ECF subfamily